MRIAVDTLFRIWDADGFEEINRVGAGLCCRCFMMALHGLDQLLTDGIEGMQRGQWVLEDVGNLFATKRAEGLIGRADQILAFEAHGTSGDDARW